MHKLSIIWWTSFAVLVVMGCKKSNAGDPNVLAIHGISPAMGGKNTTLTISGTNFSANPAGNVVTINGHGAIVTYATATSLTVIVPPKAGTGNVEVSVGDTTVKGPVFTYQFKYYTVTTLAGSSRGYLDGKGTNAQFGQLNGLAFDKDGNIIVVDGGNSMVRKIQQDGTVTRLAGSGAGGGNQDGPALSATFRNIRDVAVDKDNNIYVTDNVNNNIRKLQYSASGYNVITLAGPTDGTFGFLDGTGANARFYQPSGLTIDTVGNLYVCDVGNYAIRKVSLSDAHVITLAGSGAAGSSDGYSTNASFTFPEYVDISLKGGYLFIVDQNKIRKLTPSASNYVNTEIGPIDGASGYQDGSFTAARFNTAVGITIDDARDHVFIADFHNHCIRMVDTKTHIISTLVGNPSRDGTADGPVGTATFSGPSAIKVDKDGNLFITDTYKVRRIDCE